VVIVLSAVSGLLAYAAFPPIGLWWCAPISLALLIHLLSRGSLKGRVATVMVFGVAFFGPLLAWSNTYVGDVPWVILTVLQVILLAPLALLPMTSTKNLFMFPFLWIGTEYLRGHFPFNGFGWGRLAFSQADAPYAQIARIGGAPLLGFFVAMSGLLTYLVFQQRVKISILLLASLTFITYAAVISRPSIPKRDYSFIAVQGGVPSLGLDFNSRATQVFENHLSTTVDYLTSHLTKPEVIVWPENSIDVDPFTDSVVRDQLQSVADEFKIPLVVGAVLQHGSNFQNASILWEPRKGPTSIYIKRHLTPFGEYIPLRTIAEIVSPFAKNVVDFVPGDQIVVHKIGRARFAPVICFELLDDASGRTMAKMSNAIIVQTNSATFGLSPESDQQLAITRIRSIEHQRYSISISTSGISALIDPRGRVTHRTGQNQAAVIDSRIGLINSVTVADKYGSDIEAFLLLFPLILISRDWMRRRRPPR
jgi:apolipoprotein N-acyltransferase